MDKPFWEKTYGQEDVSTFTQQPTGDVFDFFEALPGRLAVLDVGCGEGRNAIYMAAKGHTVDAFDLSAAGIAKAQRLAAAQGVEVNFRVQALESFGFEKEYDVILCHGVLHMPEKPVRDAFIHRAQQHTRPGGYNVVGIFTNRRPAAPDLAPFTKSLFDVGELPQKYAAWELVAHDEYLFEDEHPGGIRHEHAYERIIARKPGV